MFQSEYRSALLLSEMRLRRSIRGDAEEVVTNLVIRFPPIKAKRTPTLCANWLPILRLLRTDWFKDMRDLAPALDSLIRPLLLTHAHSTDRYSRRWQQPLPLPA